MNLHELRTMLEQSGDRTLAEIAYLAAARSKSLPDYASEKWKRNESKGKGATR